MAEDEFWAMSWATYERRVRGYWLRDQRQWDHSRHLMAALYSAMSGKKVKPTQVLRLPLLDGFVPQVDITQFTEADFQWFDRAKQLLTEKRQAANGKPEQHKRQNRA